MSQRIATTLALSAAALFIAGCGKDKPPTEAPSDAAAPAAADPDKKVRCYGANECSGKTACDVKGKWDCAGNNDCCGKGWIHVKQSDCDAVGGGPDESFLGKVAGACEGAPAEGGESTAPAEPAASE